MNHHKTPYRRGADQGFIFGLYLSILFFATVFAYHSPIASFAGMALIFGVPFVIYHWLRRTYVEEYGTTLLSSLWMQGIVIFICGSLLSGAVSIIYLKWINPGYIVSQLKLVIETYRDSGWESGEQMAELLQRMIDAKMVPSAISIVIEMIWLAVFSGSLLSLLMGLLVRARPYKRQDRPSA